MTQPGLAKIKSWDKNKNGILEKSEIPTLSRDKFAAIAERHGLSLEKGIPLEKVFAKAGGSKAEFLKRVDKKADRQASKRDAKATDKDTKSDVSKPVKKTPRNDFARANEKSQVRGFGTSKPKTMTSTPKPAVANGKQPDAKESREQRQLRVLVRSMMAQHDKNKNGRLEKREWSKLRGNPGRSDKNRDGILTSDELGDHLVGYGKRERDPTQPRKSSASKRSAKKSTIKTYRFRTAHERLPKGLPPWFVGKDTNADGQLTFREFTARLSQAKLDEFNALDLNHDGLIVAKEYLIATE